MQRHFMQLGLHQQWYERRFPLCSAIAPSSMHLVIATISLMRFFILKMMACFTKILMQMKSCVYCAEIGVCRSGSILPSAFDLRTIPAYLLSAVDASIRMTNDFITMRRERSHLESRAQLFHDITRMERNSLFLDERISILACANFIKLKSKLLFAARRGLSHIEDASIKAARQLLHCLADEGESSRVLKTSIPIFPRRCRPKRIPLLALNSGFVYFRAMAMVGILKKVDRPSVSEKAEPADCLAGRLGGGIWTNGAGSRFDGAGLDHLRKIRTGSKPAKGSGPNALSMPFYSWLSFGGRG